MEIIYGNYMRKLYMEIIYGTGTGGTGSTWHDLVPGTIWYLVPGTIWYLARSGTWHDLADLVSGIHIYGYIYIHIYPYIYTYPYIYIL